MIAKLKVPSKVCPLHLALGILGPLVECVLHLGSMRVAEHMLMAVFARTSEYCALDMYWVIYSSWNSTAAQTTCSSSAPKEFAQGCQTTSAAAATAGQSCNQGRARRMGRTGEIPRSLR